MAEDLSAGAPKQPRRITKEDIQRIESIPDEKERIRARAALLQEVKESNKLSGGTGNFL